MASIGSPARVGDTESSLEKIKRQLTSGSGRYLLQGPLLKRSETLRKWNERWMILDPTNGKMEYKTRRHETVVKGTIIFDSTSTITLSPLNFHGLPKYEGCCLYIGTPQKKEYFLCAETPGAARAWISTLHATQLVLRAHKEAVNSLSGNGSAKLGTVATVVAAANATAMEASKEIETAMKISMRAALGLVTSNPNEDQLDDLSIMKETLRVKDEELSHLAKDLRARDSTIREIADKLTETAEAAQAAATAAHLMDEERRLLYAKIEYLKSNMEKEMESSFLKICAEKKMKQAAVIQAFALFKESEEKVIVLSKERQILLKQRETAFHEAQLWRSELAKARERAVVLEGAVIRAEEKARVSESHAEARRKEAIENVQAAEKGKEELLALVNMFQSQVQRQESSNKEVCEERSESSSHAYGTPLTKHVDLKDDVDKACLSDTRLVPVSENSAVPSAGDGVDIRSIGEAEWGDMQLSDARMPDVREISPELEGGSLDIPVVSPPVSDYPLGGSSLQP